MSEMFLLVLSVEGLLTFDLNWIYVFDVSNVTHDAYSAPLVFLVAL